MASSSESTDTPIPFHAMDISKSYTEEERMEINSLMEHMERDIHTITEAGWLEMAALVASMGLELERKDRHIEHLTRYVDSKTVEISRLKHQLAIIRRRP